MEVPAPAPAPSNVADTETVVAPHAPPVDTPTATTTPPAPTTALAVDTPVPAPATTTAPPVLAAPAPMVAPDATLVPTTTSPPAPAPAPVPTPVSNPPNTAEITSHSSAPAGGVDSKPTDTPVPAPAPAPSTTAIAGSSSVQGSQDEPQSSLTKKFTVDEWKALVEFRVRVFKLPKCVQYSGTFYYRMNCPPYLQPRSLTSKSPKLNPRRLLSGGSV